MNAALLRLATTAIAAACLTACGGGGGGGSPSIASSTVTGNNPAPTQPAQPAPAVQFGTVAVSMAGEPGCGLDAVNVTVTKLRFHTSATAGANDAGWTDLNITPQRLNLAQLNNGATVALGSAALSPGRYAQARVVLDANANNGVTNSVIISGTSTELPLITQAINPDGVLVSNGFDIANGQSINMVVDFDACRSVVPQNSNFLLRPVMGVVPATNDGISGLVDKSLLGDRVLVSAQQEGVVVRATVADPTTGAFNLTRLPAGKYDVVVTGGQHAAAVVTGVDVQAGGGPVALNDGSNPILLPAAPTGKIAALLSLSPASAVEAPFGSALEGFDDGTIVSIGYVMSNLATGSARFNTLPTKAPMLARWQKGQVLTWNQSPVVTPGVGVYLIAASAPGYITNRTLTLTAQ